MMASHVEGSREPSLLDALRQATLGEFEIREELGRGGMAIVLLAHDLRLNKRVALKVLAPHLQSMAGMAARFLREAQTAASMDHPNIIPIYTYRETADFAFFTMRYVDGCTLSEVAAHVKQFPVPIVRALLCDIGWGLSFAHDRGVLHRDVKPGNVLLGRDGSVVLTDFGITKPTEGDSLTLTGQLLGTPTYMSPEQCRSDDLTFASDQYSLGVIAFELLAGRRPFMATSAGEVMAQHLMTPPPDLLKIRPDCPRELARAVMRMLEKDHRNRFPSVDDALEAAGAGPVLPNGAERRQLKAWAASVGHGQDLASTPISPVVQKPSSDSLKGKANAKSDSATPVGQSEPRLLPHSEASAPTPSRTAGGGRRLAMGLLVGLAAVAAVWAVVFKGGNGGVPKPSTPATAPTTGTLFVTQLPSGAAFFIDGVRAEGDRVELAGGEHRVRFDVPGQPAVDTAITVTLGDTTTLAYSTRTVPVATTTDSATITFSGLPATGNIFVNDRRIVGSRIALAAGLHRVRMQAPGFVTADSQIRVQAGERRSFVVSMQRAPAPPKSVVPTPNRDTAPTAEQAPMGVLMVRVRPFAKVFVDGKLETEDEVLVMPVRSGRHTLRFEKVGFVTIDTSVVVPGADTLKRAFTLLPRNP